MNPEIAELRDEIDTINAQIVELLAKRVEVAKNIGVEKKMMGLPVVDRGREEAVYQKIREMARGQGINPDGVEEIFREIVALCTGAQTEGGP